MKGVGDTVSGTSESLGQIKDVVDNISAKLTDLTEKLDGASEEEMMDILVRFEEIRIVWGHILHLP